MRGAAGIIITNIMIMIMITIILITMILLTVIIILMINNNNNLTGITIRITILIYTAVCPTERAAAHTEGGDSWTTSHGSKLGFGKHHARAC